MTLGGIAGFFLPSEAWLAAFTTAFFLVADRLFAKFARNYNPVEWQDDTEQSSFSYAVDGIPATAMLEYYFAWHLWRLPLAV